MTLRKFCERKGQVDTTYLGGHMSFYTNVIKPGKAFKKSTTSNPTDWLKNPRTVDMYYSTLLKRVKSPNSKLQTIKKINDKYRLKIQCGKYSHPLWSDKEGTDYDFAYFSSREEALQQLKEWVNDLKAGVPGVVKAVEKGYNQYKGETVNLTQYYPQEEAG